MFRFVEFKRTTRKRLWRNESPVRHSSRNCGYHIQRCATSWGLYYLSNGRRVTAGTDTRLSTALTFILAMLLHPDVQRKAQAEIDAVVGSSRLPDFDDMPHLPYLSAVLRETLR